MRIEVAIPGHGDDGSYERRSTRANLVAGEWAVSATTRARRGWEVTHVPTGLKLPVEHPMSLESARALHTCVLAAYPVVPPESFVFGVRPSPEWCAAVAEIFCAAREAVLRKP